MDIGEKMDIGKIEYHQGDGLIFQINSIQYMDEKVVAFNLEEVEGVIIDGRFGLSGQLKFFDSFNKKVDLDRIFSEKLIILNGKTIFIDDTDSPEAQIKLNKIIVRIPLLGKFGGAQS